MRYMLLSVLIVSRTSDDYRRFDVVLIEDVIWLTQLGSFLTFRERIKDDHGGSAPSPSNFLLYLARS
jgi:hypothetical protein